MRIIHSVSSAAAVTAALWVLTYPTRAAVPPQPKFTEWSEDKELFVPMRDGVRLSTDVLIPKGATGQLPTMLIRSPYDKDALEWSYGKPWYTRFLGQGYVLVLQSERGRNFSEGTYKHYLEGAGTDGFDTVQWITGQSWSNGKVGSFGCSSTGEQQWPMANSKPAGLAAILPAASGTAIGSITGNDTQGAVYRGGIPMTGLWAWWYHDMATTERLMLPPDSTQEQRIRLRNSFPLLPQTWFYRIGVNELDLTHPKNDILKQMMRLPSKDVLRSLGGGLTPFDDFVTWTPGDPRWMSVNLAKAGFSSKTPALLVNSWHDIGAGEMARMFRYLQGQNTPGQYLIMGSGPHCAFMQKNEDLKQLKFGDMDVGDARYGNEDDGYTNLVLRWFDHWLKGDSNGVEKMPKVQLHIMGKGWMTSDRWPVEGTRITRYFLGNSGTGNGVRGTLTPQRGQGAASDTYLYDPGSPVPTRGGGCCGEDMSVDQREIEMRRDVLTYSSQLLKRGLTVVGPIEVVLSVSSSAKDTDFVVKLIDVYPDGKALNLADDGFRVRYRQGYDKKALMKKGEIYQIRLTNMVTGNYFAAGHRIRLDVTSSNFPAFERNLNTGGNNFDETAWVTAENTVHHSSSHPSYVELPIIDD